VTARRVAERQLSKGTRIIHLASDLQLTPAERETLVKACGAKNWLLRISKLDYERTQALAAAIESLS
jgi:hypothetical protein